MKLSPAALCPGNRDAIRLARSLQAAKVRDEIGRQEQLARRQGRPAALRAFAAKLDQGVPAQGSGLV